jgi:methylisocitrate lyase
MSYSAASLFDPQGYMELEKSFTKKDKEYTIVGHKVEAFPEGFVRSDIKDCF